MLSRGTIGVAAGIVCIAAALVWKTCATRVASKIMEKKAEKGE